MLKRDTRFLDRELSGGRDEWMRWARKGCDWRQFSWILCAVSRENLESFSSSLHFPTSHGKNDILWKFMSHVQTLYFLRILWSRVDNLLFLSSENRSNLSRHTTNNYTTKANQARPSPQLSPRHLQVGDLLLLWRYSTLHFRTWHGYQKLTEHPLFFHRKSIGHKKKMKLDFKAQQNMYLASSTILFGR